LETALFREMKMVIVLTAGIFGSVAIVVVWMLRDRYFRFKAGPFEIEVPQEKPKKQRGGGDGGQNKEPI